MRPARRASRSWAALLASSVLGLGPACGGSGAEPPRHLEPDSPPAPSASSSARPDEGSPFGSRKASPSERALRNEKLVASVLRGVSATRGLPARETVKSRTLSRDQLLEVMLSKQEDGAPKEVLRLTGEALAALELAPPEYDFEAGVFALLQSQIAGLYDPDEKTMYLLDDLSESTAYQTLAHELVHALQDQSFDLVGALDWKPRQSDRTAAFQSLVEGDATVAMFEFETGGADDIDEGTMRRVLSVGVALSAGPDTPPALVRSLVAPYIDGFGFVQALRRRGGWPAVDDAIRRRPASTEQMLHLDKFDAREPPLEVPDPPLDPLGTGWRLGMVDVMGEQGARIAFEDWAARSKATEAAAGWGGDVFAVATRAAADDGVDVALMWHQRADTAKDAKEIATVLESRFGKRCAARPGLGPVVWSARGRDVALAAGPFTRRKDRSVVSAGGCDLTEAWVAATLAARPAR